MPVPCPSPRRGRVSPPHIYSEALRSKDNPAPSFARGRPGRSSGEKGNEDAELNQCVPTRFLPKSGISRTGGVLTRAPHCLVSTESRGCLALPGNPLLCTKALASPDKVIQMQRRAQLLGRNSKKDKGSLCRDAEKERRAAGSLQAGDSNQTDRLGKIQGWLEPLLLSCTRQQGLAQGCRSPSTTARASEQCLVRARAWKGLKMSERCREHKRVDGGTWTARGTWPSAAEERPAPRSPPQCFPSARPLRLLAANPCRDAFCSPHDLLAVPPAANGNALQTLGGDGSKPQQ